MLATAAALLLGFWLALDRTRAGMAMRATFQDPQTAALMGVRVAWSEYRDLRARLEASPLPRARCSGRSSWCRPPWATWSG
ncbi:ABC transporter permease subunit [Dankookia sp. P2]|uniref:ABC transporter permease subunit n=1 Tax=Dankookia sp. P2 TaxID=3423955 RepID=UPI003D67CBA1